jgi:hypothetical protein
MGHVISVPDWDARLKERRLKYAMALQLPDPQELEQTIKLLKSDPSGDTWVRIKQATTGEDGILSALWAKTALEWDDDRQGGKVKQYSEISRAQVRTESVWLTLLECNITGKDNKPLFPAIDYMARRDKGKFLAAWNPLPPEWSEEIYQAVLEVNPQWRPGREAQAELGEASTS